MPAISRVRTSILFALVFLLGTGLCRAGLMEDGDAHLKAGRNKETEAAYTQALEKTPNSVRALVGRGRARQALKDNDGAGADFDRALEIDPKGVPALILLARFRESALKHFKGAVDDFTRELRLNQKSWVTHFERGRAQMNAGQLPDALADLDQSIELKPDYAAAHAVRGQVLSKMGKEDEALESCRKALALAPNNALAKKGVETIEARKAKKAGRAGGSGAAADADAVAKPAKAEGSVKAGQPGSQLKDPQALAQMYEMKVKDAKYKHEAFVQAQKAVKELVAVRQGYTEQDLAVGNIPPKVRAGMNAVLEVNKKLAADPNRRDPKAIADAEKTLHENGFQGLDDFMNELGGQFESLKNAR